MGKFSFVFLRSFSVLSVVLFLSVFLVFVPAVSAHDDGDFDDDHFMRLRIVLLQGKVSLSEAVEIAQGAGGGVAIRAEIEDDRFPGDLSSGPVYEVICLEEDRPILYSIDPGTGKVIGNRRAIFHRYALFMPSGDRHLIGTFRLALADAVRTVGQETDQEPGWARLEIENGVALLEVRALGDHFLTTVFFDPVTGDQLGRRSCPFRLRGEEDDEDG